MMNSPELILSDAQPTPADTAQGPDPAARRQRHLDMLDRLAELGMALAEEIGRRVAEGPPPAAPAAATEGGEGEGSCAAEAPAPADRPTQFHHDLALAFDRAARAVRMTIGLYDRMTAGPKAHAQAEEESAPLTLEDLLEGRWAREAVRDKVGDIVERIARADNPDEKAVARLGREGRDRLRDYESYPNFENAPISEILDQICRDLGLTPDWSVLHYEPWAKEERRSGAVGRPLQNYVPPVGAQPPPPYPERPLPAPAGGSP